jgi:hypothetical protein
MSPPLGNLPYDGYEGNMDSMGFSPTIGTYSPPNVDDSQEDTIDPFGTQVKPFIHCYIFMFHCLC